MRLEENEFHKIVKDTKAMSREELKAVIDYWVNCSGRGRFKSP